MTEDPWMAAGGPAFPSAIEEADHKTRLYRGMTVRDWFAGQALPGLISGGFIAGPDATAVYAYAYADAMLKERAK